MKESFDKNISLLIIALKKGDSNAYTYLLDKYQHKLCVYAYSFVHDMSLAEDIVQNVFIRVWRKRSSLKITHNLNSFLYKSVYNEFIDQYRKEKPLLSIEEKYHKSLTDIVNENDTDTDHMMKLVQKEIKNLPPKIKETFLLSKVEGLTNKEISEYKKISIKTVESHITKSFSIIRNKLKDRINGILFILLQHRM